VFIPERYFASETFALIRGIFSIRHPDKEKPNKTRTDIIIIIIIVTCYLLTRRIISGLRIFVSRFIGYSPGGVHNHLLITLPISNHTNQ
jgi:hypothetical protein